ncbi:hypothetical protein SH2C18_47820 [Clostridium sediminicola]
MKSKVIRTMVTLGTAILTLFAVSTSASACVASMYQPKEPECLRD